MYRTSGGRIGKAYERYAYSFLHLSSLSDRVYPLSHHQRIHHLLETSPFRFWARSWVLVRYGKPHGSTIPFCLGRTSSDPGTGSLLIDLLFRSLIKALKANPSPQLQYWIILCFWEMSFEQYVAEAADK